MLQDENHASPPPSPRLRFPVPAFPNLNRRQFLARLGVVSAGVALAPGLLADEPVPLDRNFVMLFADTHCGPQAKYQATALRRCVSETLACNPRPANVLIYGDFAYLHGKVEDYMLLKELLKPLDDAGIHWEALHGNHDRRDTFAEVFPARASSLVESRKVTVVETPQADFLMMDSLVEGEVGGAFNDAQRDWLNETLKNRSKPVFVGAHHALAETKVADIMMDKPGAVGYLHGHHHCWQTNVVAGTKQLTLPSTGHWGDIGLVTLRLDGRGATFNLHMHDYYTPRPAAEPNPEWQAIVEKKQGHTWRINF
ncbi:MAG: metallophosphoesterase [Lentisphaeria bacterium]|jgi:3',5'-cyclic AMP phosphodiesterase CpdA|nr:metallophosphoesterase [Lentisphaeria bacterium]